MQQELLGRIASGGAFTMEEADSNDVRVRVLSALYVIAFIVSAITFLRWFHRAATNHDVFGRLDVASGRSAVWSFFIPLVNFVLPYQIMKSIWQGNGYSDQRDSSALVSFWWAAWLSGNLLSYVGSFWMKAAGTNASELASATLFDMVCVSLNALSGGLAILVVRGVTERQERISRLGVAEAFD